MAKLTDSAELRRRDLRGVVLLPAACALRRGRVAPDLLLQARWEGVELLLGHHLLCVPARAKRARVSSPSISGYGAVRALVGDGVWGVG